MTDDQLMTYGLAALTVIALWLGLWMVKKIFRVAFIILAGLAIIILLLRLL